MIAAMRRNSETIDVVLLIGLSLWSGYQNLRSYLTSMCLELVLKWENPGATEVAPGF